MARIVWDIFVTQENGLIALRTMWTVLSHFWAVLLIGGIIFTFRVWRALTARPARR